MKNDEGGHRRQHPRTLAMALRRARPVLSSAAAEVDSLLRGVAAAGTSAGANIVAFSGGVDSSLVAALVHRVYPERSLACTGISAALPAAQLSLAREVAATIGMPMYEVQTEVSFEHGSTGDAAAPPLAPLQLQLQLPLFVTPFHSPPFHPPSHHHRQPPPHHHPHPLPTLQEGVNPDYIANDGMACFHCKSELYGTLEAVASFASDSTAPISTEGAGGGAGMASVGMGGMGGMGGGVGGVGGGDGQQRWSGRELPDEVQRVLEACAQSVEESRRQDGSDGGSGDGGPSTPATRVVLYNGTNAEDRMDVTR